MQSGARAETFELDELVVTVVVDNATDTLSSIPAGIPQLPEMVHLLGGPSIGTHDGHTDADLWDPAREEPALLAPGTRVRFVSR